MTTITTKLIKVASHPRAGWDNRIADMLLTQRVTAVDPELEGWDAVLNDGLEDED